MKQVQLNNHESRHFSPNFSNSVAKCELNTWAWENLKVAGATFSIPYASTLLVIGCKTSSTLHPILSCLNFISWSASLKCTTSRIYTQHRGPGLFHIWSTCENCHTRHDQHDATHSDSEGEDTYGAEHLYTFRFIQPSYAMISSHYSFKNYNMWLTRKCVENGQLCTECM